ncbi:hypothetical protein WA026_018229 [Henosepilachna vigintioctopunctata]|uniref:Uncharacterized protein n=1 Tax=Henosepilachna vigintioctopunctata TaxID=420089 RepID=A0AAW1VF52_9CUCU
MAARKGLTDAQLLEILESDEFYIDSVLDESASDIEENDFVTEVEEVDDMITENECPESNDLEESAETNNVVCDEPLYKAKDGTLWSKIPYNLRVKRAKHNIQKTAAGLTPYS